MLNPSGSFRVSSISVAWPEPWEHSCISPSWFLLTPIALSLFSLPLLLYISVASILSLSLSQSAYPSEGEDLVESQPSHMEHLY